MAPDLIIYGATGYTGRMAAEQAKAIGLNFEVAGRSADKLAPLASALDVPYSVFDVVADTEAAIDTALRRVGAVLNLAGPFAHTAEPLMRACVRTGTHYLDVSAELATYALAAEQTLDADARRAGVMLMPGCGGSAAVLGCLAGRVVDRFAASGGGDGVEAEPFGSVVVRSIDVALHIAGSMSRGSAVTAAQSVTGAEPLQRRDGRLAKLDAEDGADASLFNFGDGRGAVECIPVTLPDLITIWKATGVGNVKTFVNVSGNTFPGGDVSSLPDGPSLEERQANPYHAAVRVAGTNGSVKLAALHTVNGYTFTPVAAVEAAKRTLAGQFQTGFITPAAVFGNDFIEKSVPGTKIVDL